MKQLLSLFLVLMLFSEFTNAETMTYYEQSTETSVFSSGTSTSGDFAERVSNPDNTGINTNSVVSKFVRGVSTHSYVSFPLAGTIDTTTIKSEPFKIKVYHESDSAFTGNSVKLLLIKDESTTTQQARVSIIATSDTWVEYSFDFENIEFTPYNDYDEIRLYFASPDGDSDAGGQIYYFDQMSGPAFDVDESQLPMKYYDYTVAKFLINSPNPKDGEYTQWVDNIDKNNIVNSSNYVSKFVRTGDSHASISYALPNKIYTNNMSNGVFTAKIYHETTDTTPSPNNVRLSLQRSDITGNGDRIISGYIDVTSSDEWVKYTFDMSALSPTTDPTYYDQMSLFFTSAATVTNGAGQIYYFDAITGPYVDIEPFGMSYFDNASSVYAATFLGTDAEKMAINPDNGTICSSEQVIKIVRPSDDYCVKGFDLPEPLLAADKADATFKVKMYYDATSATGATGSFQAILRNGGVGANQVAISTSFVVEQKWVEYTFDFSNITWTSDSYDGLYFNFDQSNSGAENAMYYMESLRGPAYTTSYTVSYDGNASTSGVAPADSLCLVGRTLPVLANDDLEKTGYTFLGWSFTSDASTDTLLADETFVVLQDTTLYAVWKQDVATDVNNTSSMHFNIYPNPTNGLISIALQQTIKSLSVHSLSGQEILVQNQINTNTTQLDLSNYTGGVYVLKIIREDGSQQVSRIIKN